MCQEAACLHTIDFPKSRSDIRILDKVQDLTAIIQEVQTNRTAQVALVKIALHFGYAGRPYAHQLVRINQSAHYFLENLRPLVRKTDVVCLLNRSFYFVLLGANQQGGHIVQDRLWEALLWRVHNANEVDILQPGAMMIGHSGSPTPLKDINQCIEAAGIAQQSIDVQPEKSTRQMIVQQKEVAELPTLARKLGVPYLSLLPRKLPAKLQRLVDPKLAQELHCYPIGRERGVLTVAMLDPQDSRILDRLHQETGLHIFPVLAHPQELQTALEQLV